MAPGRPARCEILAKPSAPGLQWVRVDMHLHTPASADYRDPDATYLKILQKAEERGLDIIAFTDHNSVQGYAADAQGDRDARTAGSAWAA